MRIVSLAFVTGVAFLTSGPFAFSADVQQTDVYAAETVQPVRRHFWSGDWYLKVGAAGLVAPKFEGSNKYRFSAQPLISLGRQGEATRFSSRNDNVSFALIDNDRFRAGIAGKLLWGGDNDIHGLKDDKFGGEVGGFVDVYPTDWLRVRGEVRQGIWAHKGVVADIAADAFYDVTPAIRVSGGPRATFASKDYFKTYYGVDAEEAVASGLPNIIPVAASSRWASVGRSPGRQRTRSIPACSANIAACKVQPRIRASSRNAVLQTSSWLAFPRHTVSISRLNEVIGNTVNIFRGREAVLLRPASLFLESSLLKASP